MSELGKYLQGPALFIVSGPSGCGKTTVSYKCVDRLKNIERSVSYTTREPRQDEVHGKDYFFTGVDEFKQMISQKVFLEWASILGHSYGTPKLPIMQYLADGKDVLCTIDVNGAHMLRQQVENMRLVSVFVVPPHITDLGKRLNGRGTEDEKERTMRLELADKELAHIPEYDYLLVNECVKDAVEQLCWIVTTERWRIRKK